MASLWGWVKGFFTSDNEKTVSEITKPTKPKGDIYWDYRPLFNLIGKTEGTDKGRGYNETLSYGAYTNGNVHLIGMTLKEIDVLQTQMLKHPKNKWNSSALGRYQIIRTTLRGLKVSEKLSDNVKFTESTQDYLCLTLLEQRGLSKWLEGTISEAQFMTNLSKEWASLPKPDGKGTYEGQGVGAKVQEVKNVLWEVKQRVKG